jgi:hypothetical protein
MSIARFVIQVCGWAVGLPLEILIIVSLLRGGGYRRYPVVFAYLLVNFVATLASIPITAPSLLFRDNAARRHVAVQFNWVSEAILQVLIFATVLSLIDLAISQSRSRRMLRVVLAGAALLFASISLRIHYIPPPANMGEWMTFWTLDLSLCATILDLALWMILIASRKSDRRLLLISGALGMQFTGEAIGGAIVKMSIPHRVVAIALTGSVVIVAANLVCLYVWWQTFRPIEKAVRASPHGSSRVDGVI